jgi:aspartate/methionine/tyrosine aminotransferase
MPLFDKTPFVGTDLAIGRPSHFLHPLDRYPLLGGEEATIAAIKKFDRDQHEFYVVTNGAKQGLVAAVAAVKKLKQQLDGELTRTPLCSLNHPHWPCLGEVAECAGVDFVPRIDSVPDDHNYWPITLLTSPNNPDGNISSERCDIWDAAYATPVYGFDGSVVPDYRIKVVSGSKLLGIAGVRIGWVATNEAKLASLAAEYVEAATGGVSTVSQELLVTELENHSFVTDERARLKLLENRLAFTSTFAPFCDFSPYQDGMFVWFVPHNPEVFDRACSLAQVRIAHGEMFGGDKKYRRLSLGMLPTDFKEVCGDLRQCLNKVVREG